METAKGTLANLAPARRYAVTQMLSWRNSGSDVRPVCPDQGVKLRMNLKLPEGLRISQGLEDGPFQHRPEIDLTSRAVPKPQPKSDGRRCSGPRRRESAPRHARDRTTQSQYPRNEKAQASGFIIVIDPCAHRWFGRAHRRHDRIGRRATAPNRCWPACRLSWVQVRRKAAKSLAPCRNATMMTRSSRTSYIKRYRKTKSSRMVGSLDSGTIRPRSANVARLEPASRTFSSTSAAACEESCEI